MNLKEQIMADVKSAMKEKDQVKVDTLRFLHAAIKNREIELRPNAINEQEVEGVLKKMIKQRKDSIDQFQKAARQDLVDKEQRELLIMEAYLPKQMSADQIKKLVEEAIAETQATNAKDMGKVMKAVQAKTQGQADNKMVSELVKARLQ